jgi:hypothetical protein
VFVTGKEKMAIAAAQCVRRRRKVQCVTPVILRRPKWRPCKANIKKASTVCASETRRASALRRVTGRVCKCLGL